MMRTSADCRALAEQCLLSAERAHNDQHRDLLMRIASQWIRLADHLEACERLTGASGQTGAADAEQQQA